MIAIIGFGPAGIAVANRLLDKFGEKVEISIFDAKERFAAFDTEGLGCLLNTTPETMPIKQDFSFADYSGKPGSYLKRHEFYLYLNEQRENILSKKNVSWIKEDIQLIEKKQSYKLITKSTSQSYESVILCCGNNCPINKMGTEKSLFWDQLRKLKGNNIALIGNSLTALDVVSHLKERSDSLTIFSRSGSSLNDFYEVSPDLLTKYRHLLKDRLKSETGKQLINKLLEDYKGLNDLESFHLTKEVREVQASFWRALRDSDFPQQKRRELLTKWKYQRHRAPLETLSGYRNLVKSGHIKIISEKVQSFNEKSVQTTHKNYSFDSVVDCTGWGELKIPNFLALMIEEGLISIPIQGVGLPTDDKLQVYKGMFVCGGLNYYNHFESDSIPDITRQASLIVNNF